MEKLKIGNTEFDLAPMGISEDTQRKTRSFKFITDTSYADVLSLVSNQNNFTVIQHIGSDGNPVNTYADSVNFKSLGFEKDILISGGSTSDVYTATYSVDAIERMLVSLNGQLTENRNRIDATFYAVDYILTVMI